MATILAYTSPALGHLLPISALLSELAHRGHTVHVRTLSTGVEIGQRLGFTADAIDPRIEGIQQDDWKATNPLAALKLSVAVFGRRAVHEVADLADAVARVHPDALLVDVNCWGALSAAEAGGISVGVFFAVHAAAASTRGATVWAGSADRLSGVLGTGARRRRAHGGDGRSRAGDAAADQRDSRRPSTYGRRSRRSTSFCAGRPLMLVASGKPFQYPHTEWGDAVQMIGPCVLDPGAGRRHPIGWPSIDRPIVLVTTSSEKQADANLVTTAMSALADEPVHVVATMPAGQPDGLSGRRPMRRCAGIVPHGVNIGPCRMTSPSRSAMTA